MEEDKTQIAVEKFDFDSEILHIYYCLILYHRDVKAVVIRIKDKGGNEIPIGSPLYKKAARRFTGSFQNGKIKLPDPLHAIPNRRIRA